MPFRGFCLLLLSIPAFGAVDARSAADAARDMERKADRLSSPLAMQFRMSAAEALEARHPELARHLVEVSLEQLRAGKDATVPPGVIRALAELAPDDAIAVLTAMAPAALPMLIGSLAQTNHTDSALALYRSALADHKVTVRAASALIAQLAKEKPALAVQLFQESVAAFSFDDLEPSDGWWLIGAAASVAPASRGAAADLYERILTTASAPGYGEKSKSRLTGAFQVGSATITTDNSRDTLLLAAAGRLRALEPERLAKHRTLLSRWDLSGPVTMRGLSTGMSAPPSSKSPDTASTSAAIGRSLSQFRGLPTDTDRAKLAIATAAQVRSLPGGVEKLSLAQGLCNLSTEGDLGTEALTAVSGALAEAIRQTTADSSPWLELASLIRYEHLPAPYSDPALDAADSLLALREALVQENGFTLTAVDGKTYTLAGLRGHVVLLNFWATWCPPCRKEMPDMEKLYRMFEKKGLIVLAVSDEERDTVTGFLEKQNYTFPVLLDPGRKVNTAFSVEGIPKSFLFDREGNLVSQAMDMRSERQFLEMLKKAGLGARSESAPAAQ